MELGEWLMTIFTAAIGLAAIWAAISNVEAVFQSRKIAFLASRLGRPGTRLVVGISGVALLLLATSFILLPPG